MYKTNAGQASLFDDPANFIGARLNPNNRWVQMSSMIPWDLLDEKYNAQFRNKKVGNPAKAARMGLGSHIISEFCFFDSYKSAAAYKNPAWECLFLIQELQSSIQSSHL